MTTLELGKQRAEELGLTRMVNSIVTEWPYYLKDDIHKLLGEGVEVGRYKAGLSMSAWSRSHMDHAEETALLLGIRPTAQESAEKILKDLILEYEIAHNVPGTGLGYRKFYDRAKALLERE